MEGIAGIQYREMNGIQIPVLEGVMSEEKMLASLNRYGRIAAQGNEENGPGTIRNDAPVRETDGETYENPDRSGGIPRETGRKSFEDLDQRGQDRPLQHVGNDQPSDTGGYGSAETGYGGDHSPQDRIKQEKTEKDTGKGTASAVPFLSGEIEPATAGKLAETKKILRGK